MPNFDVSLVTSRLSPCASTILHNFSNVAPALDAINGTQSMVAVASRKDYNFLSAGARFPVADKAKAIKVN